MSSRRHFGTVRKRSSGRWQAVYRVEGRMYSAGIHATRADALANLSRIESDLRRGAWIDPRAGKRTLSAYAEEWLDQRNDLAVRTKELYEYLLESHVLPTLGNATLVGLAPSKIRSWHAALSRVHPSTAAKAYRLLSSIMRTAVTDGFLVASPCKVDGAGVERPAERPVATVSEIESLHDSMPEHLRLIVSLATWSQLRRAELLGLRRKDVDLGKGILRIEQSRTVTMKGKSLVKEPKTTAGRRTIATLISLSRRSRVIWTGTPDSSPIRSSSRGSLAFPSRRMSFRLPGSAPEPRWGDLIFDCMIYATQD